MIPLPREEVTPPVTKTYLVDMPDGLGGWMHKLRIHRVIQKCQCLVDEGSLPKNHPDVHRKDDEHEHEHPSGQGAHAALECVAEGCQRQHVDDGHTDVFFLFLFEKLFFDRKRNLGMVFPHMQDQGRFDFGRHLCTFGLITQENMEETLTIYGRKPVEEQLKREPRRIETIWLKDTAPMGPLQTIQSLASENRIPVRRVPGRKLADLVGCCYRSAATKGQRLV